jgi:hypothetical protein
MFRRFANPDSFLLVLEYGRPGQQPGAPQQEPWQRMELSWLSHEPDQSVLARLEELQAELLATHTCARVTVHISPAEIVHAMTFPLPRLQLRLGYAEAAPVLRGVTFGRKGSAAADPTEALITALLRSLDLSGESVITCCMGQGLQPAGHLPGTCQAPAGSCSVTLCGRCDGRRQSTLRRDACAAHDDWRVAHSPHVAWRCPRRARHTPQACGGSRARRGWATGGHPLPMRAAGTSYAHSTCTGAGWLCCPPPLGASPGAPWAQHAQRQRRSARHAANGLF